MDETLQHKTDTGPELVEESSRLARLLEEHRIDTSQWGSGAAKTLSHLAQEILDGETTMVATEQGDILRQLKVLNLDVFYRDENGNLLTLVEDHQEFSDGRVRQRDLGTSLAEKLKSGEESDDVIGRALEEELQISGEFTVLDGPEESSETKASPSYPGLNSEYVFIRYSILIDPNDYKPEGYVENQPDKSTYFVWQKTA